MKNRKIGENITLNNKNTSQMIFSNSLSKKITTFAILTHQAT